MKKDIRNADAIACKLGPASKRATNNRLEIARKERQKIEKIKTRQKAEAIAAKRRKARGGINLSGKKEDKSDTKIIQIQTKLRTDTHCNYKNVVKAIGV